MLDIAIGLALLQTLLLWASPRPGLLKHWGGGPPTAIKDIFSAPFLFFLGFPVSFWLTNFTKQTIFGWVASSTGNTLCICKDEVFPYRLTEWIGCHGNHESKPSNLSKDLFPGIVTCSPEEE